MHAVHSVLGEVLLAILYGGLAILGAYFSVLGMRDRENRIRREEIRSSLKKPKLE